MAADIKDLDLTGGSKSFMKGKRHLSTARLRLVVLRRSKRGEADEVAFLPTCSSCREIVTDLDRASIEADDQGDKPFPRAGTLNGASLEVFPGPVYVFCNKRKRCMGEFHPWLKASQIIRRDHRLPFEVGRSWDSEPEEKPARRV